MYLTIAKFCQNFLPPQVKWGVIISNKNGIYDLPYK